MKIFSQSSFFQWVSASTQTDTKKKQFNFSFFKDELFLFLASNVERKIKNEGPRKLEMKRSIKFLSKLFRMTNFDDFTSSGAWAAAIKYFGFTWLRRSEEL